MMSMNERPKAQRKGRIHVDNPQLRDLVHATEHAGEILSVQSNLVVRYDLYSTEPSVKLAHVPFRPTTLSYSPGRAPNQPSLVAVGGRNGKVMVLSLRKSKDSARESFSLLQRRQQASSTSAETTSITSIPNPTREIVNSVSFVPSPYDTSSLDSSRSTRRRLVISSNDRTVRIFQLDEFESTGLSPRPIVVRDEGIIRYNTCINHASVSPDGRILLTAGDTPHIHLHSLSTASRSETAPLSSRFSSGTCSHKPIHVIPTSTLEGPSLSWHVGGESRSSVEAIFSTAFSADGLKFASGSQDGIVQVWDIRSLKRRLALFNTTPAHLTGSAWSMKREMEGNVDIVSGKGASLGKNWGIRCLRFSPASSFGITGLQRELLAFSSHQSTLHFVDARTFDIDESLHTSLFLPGIFKRHTLLSYSNDPTDVDLTEPITASSSAKKRKRADSDEDGNAEPKRREGLPAAEDVSVNSLRAELARQLEYNSTIRQAANHLTWSTQSQDGLSSATTTALTAAETGTMDQVQAPRVEPPVPPESAAFDQRDDAFFRQSDDLLQSSERLARRLRGVSSRLQDIVGYASANTAASTSYATAVNVHDGSTSVPQAPQQEIPAVQPPRNPSSHLTLPTQLPVLQVTPPLLSATPSERSPLSRFPERRYGVYIPGEGEGADFGNLSRRQVRLEEMIQGNTEMEPVLIDRFSDEDTSDEEFDLHGEGERPSFSRDALHAAMQRWGLRSAVEGAERGEDVGVLDWESDENEDAEEDDTMDLTTESAQPSSTLEPIASSNGTASGGANGSERVHPIFGPRRSPPAAAAQQATTSRSDRWRQLEQRLSASRLRGATGIAGMDASEPLLLGFPGLNPRPRFVASPEPIQAPLPTLGGTTNRLTNRVVRMFGNTPVRSRFDLGSHLLSPPPAPAWQLFNEPSVRRPFSSRAFGGASQTFSSVSLRTHQGHADDSDGDGLVYTDEENEEDKAFEDGPVEIAGFTFGLAGTESEGTLLIGATLPSPTDEVRSRMSDGMSGRWRRGATARLVVYDMTERKAAETEPEGEMVEEMMIPGDDGKKRRPTWPLRTRKGYCQADFV